MKKGILFAVILLVVITFGLVFIQLGEVRAQGSSFNGVTPFTTVGGLMGFFDQRDGKIYLYDGNLQNCILVRQITELGKSMKLGE